jgi:zinc transport system substrate-binding protein
MLPWPRRTRRAAVAALAVALAAGCAQGAGPHRAGGAADGPLGVVAAFYPLQFLAQRIGGDRVSVTNLVKAGTEPHDLELRPRQLAAIVDADLVLYLRGFQPAVDDAVAQEARRTALDLSTVTPPRPDADDPHHPDPHIWLDPVRFAAAGDRVANRLAEVDPAHAGEFHQRAAALDGDLAALDREYATRLRRCARREIITSHAAFGYLADRYGLTQVPVTGISPESEPGPGRMARVADLARAHGATTIFFETLVSPKVAQAVAAEVGATATVLDPIEGLAPGPGTDDYLSVMRRNLDTLTTALGCS